MHKYIDTEIFNTKRNTNGSQYPSASCSSFCLKLNKYIFWHGTYSEDEMSVFDKEYRQWKRSQDESKWYLYIPEAKPFLKEEMVQYRKDLDTAEELKRQCDDIIYRKATTQSEDFWNAVAEVLIWGPYKKDRESLIKRNSFILSTKKRDGDDLRRAKQFPVSDLIKLNGQNKAQCPWCLDKDCDDLHYYRKTNSVYCFACNKSADVIDLYQKLFNVSLSEAIKKLS